VEEAVRPTLRFVLALCALILAASCKSTSPKLARSWGFAGTVTQVWDPSGMLLGNAYPGMAVTGHFGTSTTSDVDARPNLGHFEGGDAWVLAPGFGANPKGAFDLLTWNNAASVPGDKLQVDQTGTPSDFVITDVDLAAKGVKAVGVRVQFKDASANALAGDHLPSHIDVAHWDEARFWVTARDSSHQVWYVVGTVDNVWDED
jgi:hypothetical protein